MKEYIFKTTTTMKEYNRNNWWIDSEIIREIRIEAENTKTALEEYRRIVNEKYYIEVTKNGIKNKNAMYRDLSSGGCKQIGYVITGACDFEKGNYTGVWVKQYIDLWVEILEIDTPEFLEV